MRTYNERKHNTWNKIKKKLNILKFNGIFSDYEKEFESQPHRLAKDKAEKRSYQLHTNNKAKRYIKGNYQKSRNYSKHDLQQLETSKEEE